MKYGIQHDNGKVISINSFENDIVPETHTELTEEKYNSFLTTIQSYGVHVNFDAEKVVLVGNDAAKTAETEESATTAMRDTLRKMSIEIDLAAKLGEDTTGLQADFDAKIVEYQGR